MTYVTGRGYRQMLYGIDKETYFAESIGAATNSLVSDDESVFGQQRL